MYNTTLVVFLSKIKHKKLNIENIKSKSKAMNPNKEIEFLRNILDNLPAVVYINELGKPGDIFSLRNIWMNKRCLEIFNRTQEEITNMGHLFVNGVIHPDDMEIVPTSIKVVYNFVEETILVFMYRVRKAGTENYGWYYFQGRVIATFDDGSPKQLLTIGMEVTDTMHTQNQLSSALKEISRLKYALKLSKLTTREKEVLHLIAKGKTDKEISAALFISLQTAKKHRSNLILKTGVNNTAELVALAVEAGEY